MKYSIDTSAILDAWRRYYPPDVFPHVWKNLVELIDQDVIIATELVLGELERKDDEVYKWAKQQSNLFIPIDEEIQLAVLNILQNHKKLIDQRKNRSGADPFVIALAQIKGCAVLTGEKPTTSLKRPNIPDVCKALRIRNLNMIQLFREQKWIFQ